MRARTLITAGVFGLWTGQAAALSNYLEVAEQFCAVETRMLSVAAPKLQELLRSRTLDDDQKMLQTTEDSFNKYSAWSVVAAVQVGSMVEYMSALQSDARPTEAQRAQTRDLTNLTACLVVDDTERAAILEWAAIEAPEGSDVGVVFKALDQMQCRKWLQASTEVLALDVDTPDAKPIIEDILQATVGTCQETN